MITIRRSYLTRIFLVAVVVFLGVLFIRLPSNASKSLEKIRSVGRVIQQTIDDPESLEIDLSDRNIDISVAEALNSLSNRIVELDLSGSNCSDLWLRELRRLPKLKSLNVSRTDTSDEFLSDYSRFPQLTRLSLSDTNSLEKYLHCLLEFPKLEALSLRCHKLSGYMTDIWKLKSLKRLSLGQTSLSDSDFAGIEALINLESLHLDLLDVSNETMFRFSKLSNLQEFQCDSEGIDDLGISQLSGCRELRILNLAGTRVSDLSIDLIIRSFPNLRKADLHKTLITPQGFAKLSDHLPHTFMLGPDGAFHLPRTE